MSHFQSVDQTNPKDKAIAEALNKLIGKFDIITEFNPYELKALSILQTDKYLTNMLKFFVVNKKHIKRKYANEILEAMEKCTRESQQDKKMLSRLLRRE